MHTNNYTNNDS